MAKNVGYVEFSCDECGTSHKVLASDFDFENVEENPRQMGVETCYEGEVEVDCQCGQCITVTHRFWYYAEEENTKETEVSNGTITHDTL